MRLIFLVLLLCLPCSAQTGLSPAQRAEINSKIAASQTGSVHGARLVNGSVPLAKLATPVVATTDPRLTDARVPLAHNHVVADISDFPALVATNLLVLTNVVVQYDSSHVCTNVLIQTETMQLWRKP